MTMLSQWQTYKKCFRADASKEFRGYFSVFSHFTREQVDGYLSFCYVQIIDASHYVIK